jgi:rhodanese-related sulfurtransferase
VSYDAAAAQALVDANAYKASRAAAYPSIPDQLDQIYHEGIDAWKATIAAVKQEYPKP